MHVQRLARSLALVPFALLILGAPIPLPVIALCVATAGALALAGDRSTLTFATLDVARRQRHADSRRNWLALLLLVAVPATMTLTIAPSLSSEDSLPDVSALKPFTAECNYMSREGYLIYIARRSYGMELSRSEARRIVQGRKRGTVARRPARDEAAEVAERPSRPTADRPERLERMRDEYRTRRAGAAAARADVRDRIVADDGDPLNRPSRYRAGRRVLILPFVNVGTKRNPSGRVEEALAGELAAKGYEVVPVPHEVYHDYLEGRIGKAELRQLAESLGVEYVVNGRVTKYAPYKKVRLAGLMLGGLLTGVQGYGDVALEGGVYSYSADEYVANRVSERSRKQVLGIVSGTNDLLAESLRRAANRFVQVL